MVALAHLAHPLPEQEVVLQARDMALVVAKTSQIRILLTRAITITITTTTTVVYRIHPHLVDGEEKAKQERVVSRGFTLKKRIPVGWNLSFMQQVRVCGVCACTLNGVIPLSSMCGGKYLNYDRHLSMRKSIFLILEY